MTLIILLNIAAILNCLDTALQPRYNHKYAVGGLVIDTTRHYKGTGKIVKREPSYSDPDNWYVVEFPSPIGRTQINEKHLMPDEWSELEKLCFVSEGDDDADDPRKYTGVC